jgi:hypothetical protein
LLDQRAVALAAQLVANVGGAPVLPDDRVVDRLASLSIPHERSLALVRDSDRRNIGRPGSHSGQRLEGNSDLRKRDLLGIVLNPSRLRKDLLELLLRHRPHRSVLIEQKRPRTRRPLIQRQNVFHNSSKRFTSATASEIAGSQSRK